MRMALRMHGVDWRPVRVMPLSHHSHLGLHLSHGHVLARVELAMLRHRLLVRRHTSELVLHLAIS